ncbi:RRXRR domain-containing protein [candidate division WOR-3 bacterium]|nr:RRXRR domain-containing protein [candidate division WOR-3 bacterium]
MRIPVLDKDRKVLMPTTPAKARLLLKTGKARPYWNKLGIFCVILTYSIKPNNQTIVMGIDPGSKFEGYSVTGTKETVLNGMSEAVTHVKKAIEQRRGMRKARRHRNCRRRKCRSNHLSGRNFLPPSTRARWAAKLRILEQIRKVIPITNVVVEDVKAVTKKGKRRWNRNFSPLEVGKKWFYNQIRSMGFKLTIFGGYVTKKLRDFFHQKKTPQKSKKTFESHGVDAWVLAAGVAGAIEPTEKGIYYWIPLRFHRRQLHYLQPSKGGIRKPYGSTRSYGLKRGTLVNHVKYGRTYVGGMQQNVERVSVVEARTGIRLTQYAKIHDLRVLTTIAWRTQFIPSFSEGVSLCR